MMQTVFLFSLSVLVSSQVRAEERRTLVAVGPQVGVGIGNSCSSTLDTMICGPGHSGVGLRAAATTKVNQELSFGISASIDNNDPIGQSSRGSFETWKATAVGLWSFGGRLEAGRWMSAEVGVASTTAIAQLEGGTKTFHAPHLGFNWGHHWNPGGGAVIGVALQGAVSFFNIGERSKESFDTVLWLGVATSIGYAF
jgi:hypothetical protein